MNDHIWSIDNAVPDALCQELQRFLKRFEKYSERSQYGEGENTNCHNLILTDLVDHPDHEYLREHQAILAKVMNVLTELVKTTVSSAIQPISDPVFSPPQLRHMLGPTRMHFDNVSPCVVGKGQDLQIASRIVTFILTLSDSEDELVFPRQNRVLPLKKGLAVLFPPYWMYQHYTQGPVVGAGRYSLTTWLYETSPVVTADSLPLPEDITKLNSQSDARFFRLPDSLRRKWWDLAAGELLTPDTPRSGFETFLVDFKNFLQDRDVSFDQGSVFDVLARAPGSPLKTNPLKSLFNLGDETTHFVVNGQDLVLRSGEGWSTQTAMEVQPSPAGAGKDLEVLLVMGI